VYCAARNDHRHCEADPLGTMFINTEAPVSLARMLEKKAGAKFIYCSSSKVFSGNKGSYTEKDEVDPTGPYGKTKANAEEALSELGHSYILRLGTIYGFGLSFHTTAILSRLLKQLHGAEPVPFISDEYRTFFDVAYVAEAIETIIEEKKSLPGIYHLASEDKDSYFSFAKKFAHALNHKGEHFKAIAGSEFRGQLASAGGPRGDDLTLVGHKFIETFLKPWPSVRDSLEANQQKLYLGTL
jgi:dTDP-4-dehydrorhamnose reductase